MAMTQYPWTQPSRADYAEWGAYAHANAYASRARVQVRDMSEEMADVIMQYMGCCSPAHNLCPSCNAPIVGVGYKLEAITRTEATGT
jgi:hypothetical protein